MYEMKNNAYEEGMEILEQMLGKDKDRYIEMLDGMYEGLAKAVIEQTYGTIYRREGLDLKTRQLITVALLIENGNKEQLQFHTQSALNVGVTKEELIETILQSIIIVGLPKALFALRSVKELF